MQVTIIVATLTMLMGTALGNPNVETVVAQCQIAKELAGQTISAEMMARTMPQMMGLYAPSVDCSQVPTSDDFGFSLKGATVSACFAEAAKKYGGMQIIDLNCEDIAPDESGNSVMLFQPSTIRMRNGQVVNLPMFTKYDFDNAGKIISYITTFDTSILDSDTPAAQNIATIKRQCAIFQQMIGQPISDALFQRLGPQMMAFYTPLIDCDQVGTSEEFGFKFKQVPVSTCNSEASRKYGGLQTIDIKEKDIAADKHGNSVMLYEVWTFKMATGATVSLPVVTKYDFNIQGKIVATSTQYDTSVLQAYSSRYSYSRELAMPASKNLATVERVCKIFQEIAEGQVVDQTLMGNLMQRMMKFYTPTINCDQVATNPDFGFSLRNVPVEACFGEAGKKYGGMQIVRVECKDIAADQTGKSVLVYQPSTFRMVSGRTMSTPVMSKYEFNDQGQIVAYSTEFDTSVLEGSRLQNSKSFKFETPALTNLAVMKKGCKLFQEMMEGQTVNEASMQRISTEMAGFYAPVVNCKQVETSAEFGFSLHGVPVAACFSQGAKQYRGIQMVHMTCEDITVDESGKSVMVYQPSTFRTPAGEMISVPVVSKYDFNDEGKIVAYSTQFDTSVLLGTYSPQNQYSQGISPQSQARSSATVRNSASALALCKIFEEMAGQVVGQSMLAELSSKMMGFYAPTVTCDQVATSTEFGVSLQGVPVSTCWSETTAKFAGTQIVNVKCEDIAADASGRSVMSYQPSTFMTPTGEMISVPVVSKYDFNDEGKIVAYSTQFDTSAFSAPASSVALLASQGTWSPSLALAFSLGCLFAVSAMHTVSWWRLGQQQTPLLQEGYSAYLHM